MVDHVTMYNTSTVNNGALPNILPSSDVSHSHSHKCLRYMHRTCARHYTTHVSSHKCNMIYKMHIHMPKKHTQCNDNDMMLPRH